MQAGRMLAHYRVEEKIGAGGMGEVYRARDTVLDRDIALKILPERFAEDRDRMARFEREAKTLASLHHPNIASIFGFENTDECTFLVMELVDGEDLSDIIRRGAIPVDEAVDIARQIAEGLEEAHEKGIVHRDLKPANVKRTPDGKVKVLDFGLARAFAGQTASEGAPGNDPTLTSPMTVAGTVLGTAAYMSPEQARGLEVDRRADIWAFGVILFEMLTGKQLFAGETASDTLAGILKTEPEWSDLPADLPWQVERVLRRTLSKDPRQRLRDIGEARVRLEDPEAETSAFSGPVAVALETAAGRRRTGFVPWVVAGLALAALAWALLIGKPGNDDETVLHLGFPAPPGLEFDLLGSFPSLPQLSPDGSHIVFGAVDPEDSSVHLYVRSRDSHEAVRLDGTDDAQYPFWSPDSEWIGFFDRNEGLKKIRAGGGPAQVICAAGNAKGGSWSEEGQIIFAPEYNQALQIVPAVGGEPRPLTELATGSGFDSHRHPQFLPGGRTYLYLSRGIGGNDSEIRLGSLDGKAEQVLMKTEVAVRYANEHLLYVSQATVMAQRFDAGAGQLVDQPVPLAENVLVIAGAALAAFSVSSEGSLLYLRGSFNSAYGLRWMDRSGLDAGAVGNDALYDTVVLSPDGRSAAVTIIDRQAGTSDIWIHDLERDFSTRLTTDPADDVYPVWQSDSRTLLFSSDRTGRYAAYRKAVGSTTAPELILQADDIVMVWDVSGDGNTMLYSTEDDSTGIDLWAADLGGTGETRPLVTTAGDDGAALFSPDGRWVSYFSTASGQFQTYLAPWPQMSPVSQVSTTTGTWSYWVDDMERLFFQEAEGRMMEVSLTTDENGLRISAPVPLFDHATTKLEGPWLDVTADGERFLTIDAEDQEVPGFCDLVINWPARIRQQ